MYPYLKLSGISTDSICHIDTSCRGFKGLNSSEKSEQNLSSSWKMFLCWHKTFRLPALFAEVQQFHLSATEISFEKPLFFFQIQNSASGDDQKAEQTTHIHKQLKQEEWNDKRCRVKQEIRISSCVLAVTFLRTALGILLGYLDSEQFRPASRRAVGKLRCRNAHSNSILLSPKGVLCIN